MVRIIEPDVTEYLSNDQGSSYVSPIYKTADSVDGINLAAPPTPASSKLQAPSRRRRLRHYVTLTQDIGVRQFGD